jgi:type II secretory pathway pseudopilin PulG
MPNRLLALGSRLWDGVAPKLRSSEGGMSLIEATVVLGVVSMLTAVLAPSVRNYVQGAQQVRAKKDVEMIGAAIAQMLTDTGELWVLRNGTQGTGSVATTHVTPLHSAGNRVDLLVSEGRTPTVQTARSSGSPDWNADVCDCPGVPTGVQKLEWFLTLNTPSKDSTLKFRTATGMTATSNFDPDSGGQFNSEHAWRGAYLPGPIGADPWGFRYAVNVEYMARALGTGPSGNVNDVMVISAGNNGLIETRYDTEGSPATGPASGNDVIYIVAGGTR